MTYTAAWADKAISQIGIRLTTKWKPVGGPRHVEAKGIWGTIPVDIQLLNDEESRFIWVRTYDSCRSLASWKPDRQPPYSPGWLLDSLR